MMAPWAAVPAIGIPDPLPAREPNFPVAFLPLPSPLADLLPELAAGSSPVVVDLGCGDGGLACLLAPFGLGVQGLDLFPPAVGTAANLVGNALQPPLQTGRVDLLLAGNVLRHLWGQSGNLEFLDRWRSLLKPGGHLYILEDEPGAEAPAEHNYQRVQEFLARLSGRERAPLLALEDFRKQVATGQGADDWTFGLQENDMRPDLTAVLEMLGGCGAAADGEVARLIASLKIHGLSYGCYWWATVPAVAQGSE